ncbi:hypothetical protein Gogos_000361, partial [Gossypium gossypioides]|nr:hypothetical protein [Gossypium gossypioides]
FLQTALPLLLGSGFCYRFVACGAWLVLGFWNSVSVLVSGCLVRASHRFHFLLQFRRFSGSRFLLVDLRAPIFVSWPRGKPESGLCFVLGVVGCMDLSALD